MASDEIKAAADFLRPCMDMDEPPTLASSTAIKAMWWLSRAYLAERDDQPIAEEWLRGLGFKQDDERPFLWINEGGPPKAGGFDLCMWNDGDCTLEDPDNSIILNQCKTRGDLLRLLAALGITPEKT
jgi:hypothetical protein